MSSNSTSESPSLILIVDDQEINRVLFQKLLKTAAYRTEQASDGVEALERFEQNNPDAVLLDYDMPRMNGLEVIKAIRAKPTHALLPIIMLTGRNDESTQVECLNAGASDFVNKPVGFSELIARIRAQLRVKALTDELEHVDQVLFTLAKLVEARDKPTMAHAEQVAEYSVALGKALQLSENELKMVRTGALLHDLGLVALPDSILLKPGPLTPDEWIIMKRHPVIGAEIIASLSTLRDAHLIVLHHHERWDGTGYPKGLAGDAIPLGARLVAVADSFSAMTRDRPHRALWSFEQAREILRQGMSTEWDPQIVTIALNVLPTGQVEAPSSMG